ncbi:MAG: hypothetical protein Q8N81_05985, partial [bacterium]|nr:hypothetical protein [bacterium]
MPTISNNQTPSFERESGFRPHETETAEAPKTPEQPETPEGTAEQAINDAEQQYGGLLDEQVSGLARIDQTADDLGLDKRVLKQQRQDKVVGPFEKIKTAGRQLFDTLKTTVKGTLVVGMGAATMTAAAENRLVPGIEQVVPSVRQEQVIGEDLKTGSGETPEQAAARRERAKTGEAREQESEKRILTEEELKQAVFTDENESSFIASDSTGGKFQEVTTGDETNVIFDTRKVQEAAKKSKNLVVAHTHTLESYTELGYKAEDVEKMRAGELPIPPTPPSTLDLRTSAALEYYVGKANKGAAVTNRVFEPTGVWEYRADPHHPFVKAVEASFKKLDKGMKKAVAELPKEDRRLLKSKGMERPLPGNDVITLDQDPQTEHVGDILDASLRKAGLGTELDKFDTTLDEMDMAAKELRSATMTGQSAETKKYLTEMYIGVCRRNGIDMKYSPYPPNTQEPEMAEDPSIAPATEGAKDLDIKLVVDAPKPVEGAVGQDQSQTRGVERSHPPLAKDNPQRE